LLQSVRFLGPWQPLCGGWLAIGHRPKIGYVKTLAQHAEAMLVTLLSEREGAPRIGAAAERHSVEWLWLPMESADIPAEERMEELLELFGTMKLRLGRGAAIGIHCSAGIHRTGMIANAFLYFLGIEGLETERLLHDLRPLTAQAAGAERLAWGSRFKGLG